MVKDGLILISIENVDYILLKTICEYLDERLPYKYASAMLLIELDNHKLEQVEAVFELIRGLCYQNEASEFYIADN